MSEDATSGDGFWEKDEMDAMILILCAWSMLATGCCVLLATNRRRVMEESEKFDKIKGVQERRRDWFVNPIDHK